MIYLGLAQNEAAIPELFLKYFFQTLLFYISNNVYLPKPDYNNTPSNHTVILKTEEFTKHSDVTFHIKRFSE